jgi:lipoyl synthase
MRECSSAVEQRPFKASAEGSNPSTLIQISRLIPAFFLGIIMSDYTKLKKPDWLKIRLPSGEKVSDLSRLLKSSKLTTVCEEARCPNMHECWTRGTATFLILGDTCTRSCGFCNVKTGRPGTVDWGEADRVVAATSKMALRHVVITSVDRDDLPDKGAGLFALVINKLKQELPDVSIEVLIPDFKGDFSCLRLVLAEKPDILNHNIETAPRLYSLARPQADYQQSLDLLSRSAKAGFFTKSGLMVGLGETDEEIKQTIVDLHSVGTKFITIGQYLQPTKKHLNVDRYVHPEQFHEYELFAKGLGVEYVQSAPLVRSSYHAEDVIANF